MRVGVGTANPVKVRAVRRVMASLSLRARVRGVRVRTEVPEQPFGDEALQGAMNRAKAAIGTGDFGVGIEAGPGVASVISPSLVVRYFLYVDPAGQTTSAHWARVFSYPRVVPSA